MIMLHMMSCGASTSFNRVVVAPSRAASNTCSSNFLSSVRSAAIREKNHWRKARMKNHVAYSGKYDAYVSCHAINPCEEKLKQLF